MVVRAPNQVQTARTVSTVGELILEQLALWGVWKVFEAPGPGVPGLTDAMRRQRHVGYVETRQAFAAALMASAHAKLTDRLSVCLAATGPEVANLAAGLLDARTDHAPVLAIEGVAPLDGEERAPSPLAGSPMLDPAAFGDGLVIQSSDALDALLRASKAALERPGVARLSLLTDLWSELLAGCRPIGPAGHLVAERGAAPLQRTNEAATLLTRAERPVLLAGWGARRARGTLARCAETFDAPVATTCRAKGLLPDSHPLALGVAGRFGSPAANAALRDADLLLVVGCSLADASTDCSRLIAPGTQIVQIDVKPGAMGGRHAVDVPLVGDAFLTLDQLIQQAVPIQRPEYRKRLAQQKLDWQVWLAEVGASDATPIKPQRVIRELSQVCTADAIICLDAGASARFYCQQFQSRNQLTLGSAQLSVLGFSLPAANAASFARPNQQAVALCGDDGFSAVMGEFLTARQYERPITVVVLANAEAASHLDEQLAAGAWSVGPGPGLARCDYAAFATACGGLGIRVRKPEELRPALERALAVAVPALVQVDVDPAALVDPAL
jgi:thiamine pyrophosphate-dependent acetolactate synthase large subunit-like protein